MNNLWSAAMEIAECMTDVQGHVEALWDWKRNVWHVVENLNECEWEQFCHHEGARTLCARAAECDYIRMSEALNKQLRLEPLPPSCGPALVVLCHEPHRVAHDFTTNLTPLLFRCSAVKPFFDCYRSPEPCPSINYRETPRAKLLTSGHVSLRDCHTGPAGTHKVRCTNFTFGVPAKACQVRGCTRSERLRATPADAGRRLVGPHPGPCPLPLKLSSRNSENLWRYWDSYV